MKEIKAADGSIIRPLLGIPSERTGTVNQATFMAFLLIARQGWDLVSVDYGRIDTTRCRMAQALLDSPNHTHLVMLDADHVHPQDVVWRLIRWAQQDRDKYQIVGGLNYRRGVPYDPNVFLRDEDGRYYSLVHWPAGIHQVAAMGTCAICIDRRVFETVPRPWFYYTYPENLRDNHEFPFPTEDTVFAQACERAGIAQ